MFKMLPLCFISSYFCPSLRIVLTFAYINSTMWLYDLIFDNIGIKKFI